MVVFGLEWQNMRAGDYMTRMASRLSMPEAGTAKDLGLLFLRGRVTRVNDLWIVELEPNVPRVYLLPPVIMMGMALFGVTMVWPYYVLGGISLFGMLWWMPRWYSFLIKIGYKRMMKEPAEVRLVKDDEVLRRVLGWDR